MQVFANLASVMDKYSLERGDLSPALLAEAAPTAAQLDNRRAVISRTEDSIKATQASAENLGAADRTSVEAAIKTIAGNIRTLRARALVELDRPRAQRDGAFVASFLPTAQTYLQDLSRVSATLELRAGDNDTSIGRLASLARMSSTIRDVGGRRATMITVFLGSGKTFSPAQIEQFLQLDGQVTAYWAALTHMGKDVETVPGLAAAMQKAKAGFLDAGNAITLKGFAAAKGETPPPFTVDDWRAQIRQSLLDGLAPRDAAFVAASAQSDTSIATARSGFFMACAVVLAILAIVAGFAIFINRRLIQPIRDMTRGIEQIAHGVLDVEITGTARKDEVGEIGRAVEILRGNSLEMVRLQQEHVQMRAQAEEDRRRAFHDVADELDRVVGKIAGSVSSTSEELQASARGLSIMAEQTSNRSGQATQASQVANEMVEAVAAAAEELSASVTEIGARVKESARIAGVAVTEANDAASKVTTMSEAARRIGDILRLISDIAGQTNLLALNATIEAARAGEAGRGFAVVASEVKNLAEQTSKATAEIEAQISTVQRATDEAVSAITGIASTIGHMNEISTTIASAVFQQSAATDEIASSIARASEGARDASENMIEVNQTAAETGSAASQVLGASTELSRTSTELRVATDTFVARIRSA
ncbi:HAMP domain-containing methyl-accepting chemotaxis protein [Azorhizobium sp. AG788]|uniref:methyl-accepting chemotaxis protein n=1 Tax=Azorhizobium sp. AG788 TaxID=2183897 RepID=UPI0031398755